MKKIYSFMVAAIAMFVAASCAQELENVGPETQGETVIYTASTDVDTKAVLDGVVSKWCGDELITLHDGTNAFTFYANAGEIPTSTVDFIYTPGEGQPEFTATEVLAVYPSGDYSADLAGKKVGNVVIPHFQTLVNDSYPATAAVAMAYSTDKATLNFKNATTLLKFKVAGDDVTYGCIAAEGGISGTFDLAYNSGNPELTATEAKQWVDFNKNDEFLSKDATYYVAVAPASLNKLTMYLNGTEVKSKAFETPYQLVRNVILDLGTITYTAPEAASTICLKPGEWASDSPKFFAYFYNSNGNLPVEMTVNESGLYEVAVPEGKYSRVIFCRVDSTAEEFDWTAVWNQTENLNVPVATDEKLCYVITGWGEGEGAKSTGEWKTIQNATEQPTVYEWAIAGTFNGWSTTANPMVQEGDFYVAKGITGLNNTPGETESSTGFKFVQNGNVWKGSGENGGVMIAGSWNYIWGDNGCNICVDGATAETAYDIYLNPAEGDHGKFVIVAAGADMPEDKPAEEPEVDASAYGLVGSFQGWDAANPVAMEYVSDGWIVAKNVEMYKDDAFKFVQGKSWDVNYGTSGATTLEDDKETSVVKNGQNMAVLKNGKYNLYLNPNKMLVKAVCIAEFTDLTVAITIDNKANWSPLTITLKKEGNVVVNKESVTNGKYLISGNYIGSTLVCQFHSGNKASKEEELTITKNGAKATVESTEVEKPKLYLTPNSNWKVDNARFAAYFFGNGEKWVSMTDPDKDGVYEVEIPDGYPNVIFCRMNPSASANNWNNKWNQTADLVIPTNGNNHYTVKAGTWDKGGGTWSKK